MDVIHNLVTGFSTAFSLGNLMFCLLGAVLGTLIGVLPGVGPLVTISMLLPFTYTLGPTTAMIMLSGIFYGAQYGGSTTAILMRMPGEATSIVTSIDGYKLAQNGKAGTALAVAAIGSFVAGTVATGVIAFMGPALGRLAISVGPPEYFALMVLGIASCLLFTSGSILNGLASVLLGVALALVGVDFTTGALRYTFDVPDLLDGIGFVPVAIGLFGLLEVIKTLSDPTPVEPVTSKISRLVLTRTEWCESLPAMLRGTAIGTLLGVLPGGGLITAPFASYLVEKKFSRKPEEFGNGALRGVAGPEAANNAAAQTSFIPLLSLGIPSNAVMALMLSALMVQGITPGPTTFAKNPELFWGLIASMWMGNLFLLVLNLPLVGYWAKHRADALPLVAADHHSVQLRGGVQHEQLDLRHLCDGRLRLAGIRALEDRLRPHADGDGICAGWAPGAEPAVLAEHGRWFRCRVHAASRESSAAGFGGGGPYRTVPT